jgi:hypothetical protein
MAAKAGQQAGQPPKKPPHLRSTRRLSIKPPKAPRALVQSRAYIGPLAHAVDVIYRVCCLAGDPNLLDDIRRELRAQGVTVAIRRHDTGTLYDWLAAAFSYQGISDRVATDYMRRHGRVRWADIEVEVAAEPPCPKLKSYWHFCGCRYEKGSRTCAEPDFIERCPLPDHPLRNGRLNQMAYSLYFFIRDVADGDLVGWLDRQLQRAGQAHGANRPARLTAAVIKPLRHVYGVSDKILNMALSSVLLAAPKGREVWLEAGGSMIAIDTLVHNFLHRTGVLSRFGAEHAFGQACYQPTSCAEIIRHVAQRIDGRSFNPSFPVTFPRFVQHAIWRYCAQRGLDVCNGNRIDDRKFCDNIYCQIRKYCDCISFVKTIVYSRII